MSAVTESIKISIDRLTHLLQLSLVSYSPENARLLTKTIVDLIDHTTKISMETNDLVNEHKKRERELCSCLVDMDALVKRQRKKLQAVPTKPPTRDVDTSTVEVSCIACRSHEGTIANLKAVVNDLSEKNDVLHGKLVQSKCLMQAQQILLAKRSPQEVLERTSNLSMKNEWKQRDFENTQGAGLWKDVIATNHADITTGSAHVSHRIQEANNGLPPKIPPNSRYREIVTEEEMDTSIEELPAQNSESPWHASDGLQQAQLYEYDEPSLEEEEEEEGAGSPDFYLREDGDGGEDRNDVEYEEEAEAYYNEEHGDRSHEFDDAKEGSYEEHSSGSERSSSSSGSGASNGAGEEQEVDQNQEFLHQPQHNRQQQQYRQHRPATHSLDLSSDGTLEGERVDGDEDEAEHSYHRSRHHQQAAQYHTQSGSRFTPQAESEPEPGPGWDNHLNDNVEDSFSLIQNFYDVGFT